MKETIKLLESLNDSIQNKLVNIISNYLKDNNFELKEYYINHDYGTPNNGNTLEDLLKDLNRYDIYKILNNVPEVNDNTLKWVIKCNPVYGSKFKAEIIIEYK